MNSILSFLGIVQPDGKSEQKHGKQLSLFAWLRSSKTKITSALEDNTYDILEHIPTEIVKKYCPKYSYELNFELTGFVLTWCNTDNDKVSYTDSHVYPNIEAVELEISTRQIDRIRDILKLGVMTAEERKSLFRREIR